MSSEPNPLTGTPTMRRGTAADDPLRPLTWSEFVECCRPRFRENIPLYVEVFSRLPRVYGDWQIASSRSIRQNKRRKCYEVSTYMGTKYQDDYARTWRVWLQKPTLMESKAVKWTDEQEVDEYMTAKDKALVKELRAHADCQEVSKDAVANMKRAASDAADAIVKLAKEAEEAKTKAFNFNRMADHVLIAREYSMNWECLAKACQVDIRLALKAGGCTVCKYFKQRASEVWCKNKDACRGDVSKCWEWRGLCAENIRLATDETGELERQFGINERE